MVLRRSDRALADAVTGSKPMHTVVTKMLSLARSFDSPFVIAIPAAQEIEVSIKGGPRRNSITMYAMSTAP